MAETNLNQSIIGVIKRPWGLAAKDFAIRAFFALLLWLLILSVAHYFIFLKLALSVYEVPILRWVRPLAALSIWELVETFPFHIAVFALVLVRLCW